MLNFDNIPDTLQTKSEPGIYTLVVKESKIVKATKSGSMMIQNNYVSEDGNTKVNYDNCPYMDKDGNLINYGLVKLKKICKAIGVELKGNIDPMIIPPLLIGKKFAVKLDLDDKGKYLEIKDIDSIAPASANKENASPFDFQNDVDVTVDNNWNI